MKFGWVRWWWLATACLVTHVGLLVWGTLIHYPNVDEVAHLPSGVAHWKFERFDMYRVNPPLVRMVAGLPAWLAGVEYDWSRYTERVGSRPEFSIGRARQREMGLELHRDFILPRLLCIPFSVLGCVLLTIWVHLVLGAFSANLACIFWCFSPNLLAHAQTIVPDVGMVAMGGLASYAFWRYLHRPLIDHALAAGVCLGLALLTKLTWLTAVFTLPAAVGVCLWMYPGGFPRRGVWRRLGDLLLIWSVALLVLNMGYLFEGTGTRLGDYEFCSEALGGEGSDTARHGNRFEETWLANIPLPIPLNFLLGIDYLRYEVEAKRWSFLMGEHRFGSWPHYYVMTTLFKTPEATLLAAAVGLAFFLYHFTPTRIDPRLMTMVMLLGIPATVAFVSVSLQGGFNHHHRYVLQIYPVLFVLIAGLGQCSRTFLGKPRRDEAAQESGGDEARDGTVENQQPVAPKTAKENQSTTPRPVDRLGRACRLFVSIAAVAMVASSLRVAPHFLGYFNTACGGPSQGWRLLGFSNIDWGQDLLLVKRWIDEHPECRPLKITPHRGTDVEWLLADAEKPPAWDEAKTLEDVRPETTEWWIVNVELLRPKPNEAGYRYLQAVEPVDRIGYAHHVYRIEGSGE